MNEIEVSVICAWYNRADYIAHTVDSILAQRFSSFEFIIINDGSSDPRVAKVLDQYDDERLKIFSQDNVGFVKTIKRAVELSRGKYIAIQGAGDWSSPDRLQKQYDLMRSNPSVALVGCQVLSFSSEDSSDPVPRLGIFGEVGISHLLGGPNPFSHGEVMFRKSSYDASGGYRVFFKYSQDRDLWIRMLEAGEKGFVLRDALYTRRSFNDGVSSSRKKLVIQRAYSLFAVQLHFDRRDGIDYVNEYGADAALFRKSSRKLSGYLSKAGLLAVLSDRFDEADHYMAQARREKVCVWSVMGSLVLMACKKFGFVLRLLKSIAKKNKRYDVWSAKEE